MQTARLPPTAKFAKVAQFATSKSFDTQSILLNYQALDEIGDQDSCQVLPLHAIESRSSCQHSAVPRLAEKSSKPMKHAPSVKLADGRSYTPQHYLTYHQTPTSITELMSQISFDDNVLLFAGADAVSMYIQVGIIGRENYARVNAVRPRKLVYGRKWRIDADTPDSEIVQTAFLAIKKTREHEVRELLTIRTKEQSKTSAPLTSHQDIYLLTNLATENSVSQTKNPETDSSIDSLHRTVANLRFGQRHVHITRIEQRQPLQFLIDVKLGSAPLARMVENDMPEYDQLSLTLIVRTLNHKEFIYALMEALIQHSDRQAEELFRFQGQARFSRQLDPIQIAELSVASRPYARDLNNHQFAPEFRANNYEVDASRTPEIKDDLLGKINRQKIDRYTLLHGHMPKGHAHSMQDQFCA